MNMLNYKRGVKKSQIYLWTTQPWMKPIKHAASCLWSMLSTHVDNWPCYKSRNASFCVTAPTKALWEVTIWSQVKFKSPLITTEVSKAFTCPQLTNQGKLKEDLTSFRPGQAPVDHLARCIIISSELCQLLLCIIQIGSLACRQPPQLWSRVVVRRIEPRCENFNTDLH